MTGAPQADGLAGPDGDRKPSASALSGSIPSAWTPGPWSLDTVKTTCGICHRVGPFPKGNDREAATHACIYDDYPRTLATDELLANANLIAAAPELYDGCNALLGLIQLILGRDDLTPDLRVALQNSHRLIEAKAALAKARGEQP